MLFLLYAYSIIFTFFMLLNLVIDFHDVNKDALYGHVMICWILNVNPQFI